jgi:hypothetical protein
MVSPCARPGGPRSVSDMRRVTTAPEAKVSAAIVQVALARPKASATTPATTAPTA